jgi:queuosine precursor transporter
MNELIFFIYCITVSVAALCALALGKEALVALISIEWILANLFVLKQITLFGLAATASDALAIGATLSLNLLQEFYGRKIAQKTIWISFFGMVVYGIFSLLQLLYIPSSADTSNIYYRALMSPMPRIIIASLISYVITQQLEVLMYGFLKWRLGTDYFVIRNYVSLSITQLLDTILFSFLGLYGIVSNLGEIIIVSYTIKLVTIALSTPFLALSKKLIAPTREQL